MKKIPARYNIRRFQVGDEAELWLLLYNTVHKINIQDYTQAQVNAWVPKKMHERQWREALLKTRPFVVKNENRIVGFADLERNGYIKRFFCAYNWLGRGIGTLLMDTIEREARAQGISHLYAEVSITAKCFFEKKGFAVEQQQTVFRGAESFINFLMSKNI